MVTTTVLSEDTATIVREDRSRFDWGAVVAGAVIAAGVSFLLILVGAALGLTLTSTRNLTGNGPFAYLTLGAIYFLGAEVFGFAVGGHVVGRLMTPMSADSEEENFRADAHGLAVWSLAVVFGLAIVSLTAASGMVAGANRAVANAPANYWVDKLFADGTQQQASAGFKQYAQNGGAPASDASAQNPQNSQPSGAMDMPMGSGRPMPTYADMKAEAGRLLAVDSAQGGGSDRRQLETLVATVTGMDQPAASARVNAIENDMRAKAKQAAETARRAALYLTLWTVAALLFGGLVCVLSTLSAHWHEAEHGTIGRIR
jgi:hypothetical protein